MDTTNKVPNVPLDATKRTKIIATVGPATHSYEQILAIIKAGANGIRMNFSHGTNEERDQQIKWIRKASKEYGKPVAIIQDLQGPKVRLGDFDGIITVQKGQILSLKYGADYAKTGEIPLQYDLSKKMKRGEHLYIYDGRIKTVVTSIQKSAVLVRVENDGILLQRKGVNVPDTSFDGDIITEKDKEDLAYGSTQDIDYVTLSFVQSVDDIRMLKRQLRNLGSTARVIAKIETSEATENIVEIMKEADGAMVARGDLALEVSPEAVPIVQRQIIGLGHKYAKFTIVATQMLASMTESPEPTRAEVSDIATAVIVGADAVMLSDETAVGKHPIEAVEVMKRTILYTQSNMPLRAVFNYEDAHTTQTAIAESIIVLSQIVSAKAIVAETKSGATALHIAAHRAQMPIIAVTSSARVAQQLAIVHGIKSYVRPDGKMQATQLTNWLHRNKVLQKGDIIVTASGEQPGVAGATDTIKVRVL